jgi:hypothetical protein
LQRNYTLIVDAACSVVHVSARAVLATSPVLIDDPELAVAAPSPHLSFDVATRSLDAVVVPLRVGTTTYWLTITRPAA